MPIAARQHLVVAYEPVWAIGTGLTPTGGDIAEVHAIIRRSLAARVGAAAVDIRILYGGSVKPVERRASCLTSPMSTARSSAAQASRPAIFSAIASVYRLSFRSADFHNNKPDNNTWRTS